MSLSLIKNSFIFKPCPHHFRNSSSAILLHFFPNISFSFKLSSNFAYIYAMVSVYPLPKLSKHFSVCSNTPFCRHVLKVSISLELVWFSCTSGSFDGFLASFFAAFFGSLAAWSSTYTFLIVKLILSKFMTVKLTPFHFLIRFLSLEESILIPFCFITINFFMSSFFLSSSSSE